MLSRLMRHWINGRHSVDRAFPPRALQRIEAAIREGEKLHAGEVQFAVEPALPLSAVWAGMSPRERALTVFSTMRTWDTEQNCGVLVYLLLADHDVEIVADRGIHRRVGEARWGEIAHRMELHFRAGQFADGVSAGIAEINAELATHFPAQPGDRNELPDAPVILR